MGGGGAVEQAARRRKRESGAVDRRLRSEREQGITIDVAYRYFATPKRKFIIADTPGHIQYTRNMVTGASTANLAIILIDARNGVIEQTCRHSFIASLLQIQHIVVCINKMDLVDWSEDRFNELVEQYKEFASRLDVPHIDLYRSAHCSGTTWLTVPKTWIGTRAARCFTRWRRSTSATSTTMWTLGSRCSG